MVTRSLVVACPDCQSENVIRHGRTHSGYQRYRCKPCQGTFSDAPRRGHTPEFKEQVLAAYQQRSSMRGIQRVFKISRNTLTAWLKEKGAVARPETDVGRSSALR
jgi:transposase-like protein